MSRILFKKEGRAKYISHLDIMRTMQRVFIRAGVKIKHTEGYNPHPYMAFALPLSVGTESDCELMDFTLVSGAKLEELPELLTENAPEGITVLEAYEEEVKLKHLKWLKVGIELIYDAGVPEKAALELKALYSAEKLEVEKTSKGKTKTVDIIPMIDSIAFERRDINVLYCTAVISAQEPSLSPSVLLSAIDAYKPDLRPDFTRVRRLEIYDEERNIFR